MIELIKIDEKYTISFDEATGHVQILRHGQPWLGEERGGFLGSKAWISAAYEIQRLRTLCGSDTKSDQSLEEAEAHALRTFDGTYTEVHTDLILSNKGASGFLRVRLGKMATKAALAAASPVLRKFGTRQAYRELISAMEDAGETVAAQIIRDKLTSLDGSQSVESASCQN